jgi:hypothetical protein
MRTPALPSAALGCILLAISAACDASPSDPGPPSPAALEVVDPPSTAESGGEISLRFRVLDGKGGGVGGVAVEFTTSSGTLGSADARTDASGAVSIVWRLADTDGPQALTARAGSLERVVNVITSPRLVAVTIDAPAEVLRPGSAWIPQVQARTATGRIVSLQNATLSITSEQRTYADLPVLEVAGNAALVRGPGAAHVQASSDGLASDPIVITIAGGTPIVIGLEEPTLPVTAVTAAITGYDLLGAFSLLVDGVAVSATARTQRRLEFGLPATTGCAGRAAHLITTVDAYMPNGQLRLMRARPDELQLAVGEVRWLGRFGEACVRLPAVAAARYALAYFDTRAIESARNAPEDLAFTGTSMLITTADRSAPGAGSLAPGAALAASGSPIDVVHAAAPTAAAGVVDDLFNARRVPWNAGDTFAMYGENGLERGRIFHVTTRFAVGVMDRDSSYHIPDRIEGLTDALANFARLGEPLLRRVFVDEWAATTEGSGQMLVLVGDFFAGGFLGIGTGTVDRGAFIGIDPGVAEVPKASPLYFSDNVLFHEMAHAYQDRFLMERCRTHNDCGYSYWNYRWAVEGGAELLTEHLMAQLLGFSFAGNHPYAGLIHNVFGFISSYGADTPHYNWDFGYGSVTWLLRDFVVRAVRAGASLEDAFAAVERGALEGWFGHQPGVPQALGLRGRMQQIVGDFDPVPATLRALLTVAADDLTADPTLQAPFLLDAWDRVRAATSYQLDGAASTSVTVQGTTFAHFTITDPAGLGGSIELKSAAPLEWAIVRLK